MGKFRIGVNSKGFALVGVLVFYVLALLMWSVGYRKLAALMRVEETAMGSPLDLSSALARGMSLLRTGVPPADPYQCRLVLESGDEYILTYTAADLFAVSMVSSTDGWAVGSGGVRLRYNGTSWNTVTSPTVTDLFTVSMVSATDGWAVGSAGAILRYNGTSWSTVSSPTGEKLSSVYMVSATDGWAVGDLGTTLQYNGTSWGIVGSPTDTWSVMASPGGGMADCLATFS